MGQGMETIHRDHLESNSLRMLLRTTEFRKSLSVWWRGRELHPVPPFSLRVGVTPLPRQFVRLSVFKWIRLWMYRYFDVWNVVKLILFTKITYSSSVPLVWRVHCSWSGLEVLLYHISFRILREVCVFSLNISLRGNTMGLQPAVIFTCK
jgi:hypothetical protein